MLRFALLPALGWAALALYYQLAFCTHPRFSFAIRPVKWNKWVLYIYIGCWSVNGLIKEPALSLCLVDHFTKTGFLAPS